MHPTILTISGITEIYECVQVPTENQSHYREVSRWENVLEQELRFGLDLGRMADVPAFIASKSLDL